MSLFVLVGLLLAALTAHNLIMPGLTFAAALGRPEIIYSTLADHDAPAPVERKRVQAAL